MGGILFELSRWAEKVHEKEDLINLYIFETKRGISKLSTPFRRKVETYFSPHNLIPLEIFKSSKTSIETACINDALLESFTYSRGVLTARVGKRMYEYHVTLRTRTHIKAQRMDRGRMHRRSRDFKGGILMIGDVIRLSALGWL